MQYTTEEDHHFIRFAQDDVIPVLRHIRIGEARIQPEGAQYPSCRDDHIMDANELSSFQVDGVMASLPGTRYDLCDLRPAADIHTEPEKRRAEYVQHDARLVRERIETSL